MNEKELLAEYGQICLVATKDSREYTPEEKERLQQIQKNLGMTHDQIIQEIPSLQ